MSELFDNWVAKISKASATDRTLKTMGTGFISVYPWLITCNHVVAHCLGKESSETLDAGEIPGMVVEFPLCDGRVENLYQAELVVSKPKLSKPKLDDIHDIAILKLRLIDGNDSMEDEDWASEWKYNQSGNYVDHAVSAKGFFIDQVSLLEGNSKTRCTDGSIELNLNIGESIKGASGAPVWSLDDHMIIGMLASQRGENAKTFRYEKVYMIPMHKILDACTEHKAALLAYKETKLDFETGRDAEQFLADAKEEMIAYLDDTHVKQVFGLFSKKQRWGENISDAVAICDQILTDCNMDSAKLLRNLTVCTKKTLEELERSENFKNAYYLIKDMKKLVSLLSLYVLKKESVTQLRKNIVHSSTAINLTIAHESLGSAELVSAAGIQATPRFRMHEERPIVQGQYAVSHFDLEIGIGKDDSWIDEIGKKVWRVFFKNRYDDSAYSRQELRDHIGRELCADDPEKKNCYLVVSVSPEDKNESPLLVRENRQKFKEAIPELSIIILDNTKVDASFVVSDRDLMVELFKFFEMCDKYEKRNNRRSDG